MSRTRVGIVPLDAALHAVTAILVLGNALVSLPGHFATIPLSSIAEDTTLCRPFGLCRQIGLAIGLSPVDRNVPESIPWLSLIHI